MTRQKSGSWFKKTFGGKDKKSADASVTAVDVANSHSFQPYDHETPAPSPDKSFRTPKVRSLTP